MHKNLTCEAVFALVCPITSGIHGYPFEIKLPSSDTITGAVLSDQIRSLDWLAQYAKFVGRVSAQTLSDVQEKISIIMFPNSSELTLIIKIEELLGSINKFAYMFELVFDKNWEGQMTCKVHIKASSAIWIDTVWIYKC